MAKLSFRGVRGVDLGNPTKRCFRAMVWIRSMYSEPRRNRPAGAFTHGVAQPLIETADPRE